MSTDVMLIEMGAIFKTRVAIGAIIDALGFRHRSAEISRLTPEDEEVKGFRKSPAAIGRLIFRLRSQ